MEQAAPFESPQPIKLTVDDFAVLHDAGAFDAYPQAELINGAIVCMSPQTALHTLVTNRLAREFDRALVELGSPLVALVGPTVTISRHDAPEPDLALVTISHGRRYFPLESMALAVEVSRTTLRYDLGEKLGRYAEAGVPEYWVVDVEGAELNQFWGPQAGTYVNRRSLPLDGEFRSATMPELAISGAGIL